MDSQKQAEIDRAVGEFARAHRRLADIEIAQDHLANSDPAAFLALAFASDDDKIVLPLRTEIQYFVLDIEERQTRMDMERLRNEIVALGGTVPKMPTIPIPPAPPRSCRERGCQSQKPRETLSPFDMRELLGRLVDIRDQRASVTGEVANPAYGVLRPRNQNATAVSVQLPEPFCSALAEYLYQLMQNEETRLLQRINDAIVDFPPNTPPCM